MLSNKKKTSQINEVDELGSWETNDIPQIDDTQRRSSTAATAVKKDTAIRTIIRGIRKSRARRREKEAKAASLIAAATNISWADDVDKWHDSERTQKSKDKLSIHQMVQRFNLFPHILIF